MLPVRRKLAAVAIGIVLATVLALSFQYFVEYRVEQLGREEIENNARRGIALANRRIGRTIAGLVAGSARHRRMQRGRARGPERDGVRAHAGQGARGRRPQRTPLCSNHGLALGEQRVASRSAGRAGADVFIEVVTIGNRRERMIRVRRMNRDGSGLAALIPAELLLAQLSPDGGFQRIHAVMVAHDGTKIGETGTTPAGGDRDIDRIVATRKSDDYGLAVTSSIPRAGLAASRQAMRVSAILAGLGASALIVPLVLFGWRRKRDNPIAELRRAFQADEFMPYYQPILDISNGRLEGAEVLIRWRKPDGSIVAPAQFIPLLESSGLIFDVTRALMQRVCGRWARRSVAARATRSAST